MNEAKFFGTLFNLAAPQIDRWVDTGTETCERPLRALA